MGRPCLAEKQWAVHGVQYKCLPKLVTDSHVMGITGFERGSVGPTGLF